LLRINIVHLLKQKYIMKELIETLKEIDLDFYKGHYTVSERYDLIKSIYNVLNNKNFI